MYSFKGKALTVELSDLSKEESKTFDSLVRLGDSVELALWTIEHMERAKEDNSEFYRNAYCN